jgi:hypothetical protein
MKGAWYCKLCDKDIATGHIQLENHFRAKHPRNTEREFMHGGKWNRSCVSKAKTLREIRKRVGEKG